MSLLNIQISHTDPVSTESNNESFSDLPGNVFEEDFNETINEMFLKFLLKLHQKNSLTKKIIEQIFCSVKRDIIDPIIRLLNVEGEKTDLINECFKAHSSYYKFEKSLKNSANKRNFIPPTQIIISNRVGIKYKRGKPALGTVLDKLTYIPIAPQLKNFLELPNVFQTLMENMNEHKYKTGEISNIVQGIHWRKLEEKFENSENILPIVIYTDDFGLDDALGANSGTNKQTAFYWTIPVIP